MRRALILSLLLWAGSAEAWTRADWHLQIDALTDFPVDVGGKIALETPYRIQVTTTFGFLPSGYVDALNGILVAAGAYNQTTADLIAASMQSSMVWRLHLGWRPWARRGGYFEVGYGLAALGGGLTFAQAIQAATGRAPPPNEMGNGYNASALVHMIDVELGWQWRLWRGLTIRTALGFAGTVGAQTSISPNFKPRAPQLQQQFTDYAASYLKQEITSYVFTPTITLALGWRIF